MKENNLPKTPVLADYQEYVRLLKIERGFKDDKKHSLLRCFMELGELADAMKYSLEGHETVSNDEKQEIGYEIVDTMIFLIDLANLYSIDIEEAFRAKEEINKKRKWKTA